MNPTLTTIFDHRLKCAGFIYKVFEIVLGFERIKISILPSHILIKNRDNVGREDVTIKLSSILEISCGNHSKLYETQGKEWALFVGIDINMILCRQAKEQGFEVVCCDAFNLPFKPKSFQDVYVQCFTALLEKNALSDAFQKSDYDEFCEFMGTEIDYAWQVIDPFHELLLECKQVSEHIICLPSCNLEMNKYLVNAVKNLPSVTVDVDNPKHWGGKKRACVMYLDIDCTIQL